MSHISPIAVDVAGGVGVVRLARPDRRNAIDQDFVDELIAGFDSLEANPDVRAIVVTGDGTVFCAGAVLDTLIASADGDFDSVKRVYEGFLRVLRSPLPTIAAVNGPAVGAGLNLALACDVRLASTKAEFESRFPAIRLHPGGGHTWLLTRAVGRQTATMMALFGEKLDAEAALAAGLVVSIHEPDALVDAAVALAGRLSSLERDFVVATTDTLRRAEQTLLHSDILSLETERQSWSVTRPEFVNNTRALQERISSGRRPKSKEQP